MDGRRAKRAGSQSPPEGARSPNASPPRSPPAVHKAAVVNELGSIDPSTPAAVAIAPGSDPHTDAALAALVAELPSHVGDFSLDTSVILGNGAFSVVVLGHHGHDAAQRQQVAVKVVAARQAGAFQQELRVHRAAACHPNIVALLGHHFNGTLGFLILELCERGEVFRQITPLVGLSPRENVGPYFAQLLDAVDHLHTRGICHLDIKPENLFVDKHGTIKLGDFGLSFIDGDELPAGMLSPRGSLGYAAPECLMTGAPADHMVAALAQSLPPQCRVALPDGRKADMWSAGVTLFVFVFGHLPWESATAGSKAFQVYRAAAGYPNLQPWARMPGVLRTLLHRMLVVQPQRRVSAAQLRQLVARDFGWGGAGQASVDLDQF